MEAWKIATNNLNMKYANAAAITVTHLPLGNLGVVKNDSQHKPFASILHKTDEGGII